MWRGERNGAGVEWLQMKQKLCGGSLDENVGSNSGLPAGKNFWVGNVSVLFLGLFWASSTRGENSWHFGSYSWRWVLGAIGLVPMRNREQNIEKARRIG